MHAQVISVLSCIPLAWQDGNSPLHFACTFGNVEAVRYLVEAHGMNVNERNSVSVCTHTCGWDGMVGRSVYV